MSIAAELKSMSTRDVRDARIATERDLAYVRHVEKIERARAEQRAIETAGGEKALGANESARERALVLALADDTTLDDLRIAIAGHLQQLAELDAELESRADEQRAAERAERIALDTAAEQRRAAELDLRRRIVELAERLADAGAAGSVSAADVLRLAAA